MPREYRLRLQDMLEAIEKVEQFTRGTTLDGFANDDLLQGAVLFYLQVVGESARAVPDSIKNRYPMVAWKQIAGLRDIIAHHYFGLDLQVVWDVIKADLPELEQQLKIILSDETQV